MHKKWFRVLLRRRFLVILMILLQIAVICLTVFGSSELSFPVRTVLMLMSLIAVLHIVSKKDKGAYKLIWIFLILLLPVLGGLLYIVVTAQMTSNRYDKRFTDSEAKSRKYLSLAKDSYDVACEHIPSAIPQVRYLQEYAGYPVYTESKAEYFPTGERKFGRLLEELKKAEKYIFLEYFIIEEGVMWNAVLDILKEKAADGVKVRVIYDDLGCFFLLPKDYPKQLKEYGIECAVFNPFRPFLTVIQNNRDHRKIVSIDGKVCFTGGINLADEYINVREKHGHWGHCRYDKRQGCMELHHDVSADVADLYRRKRGLHTILSLERQALCRQIGWLYTAVCRYSARYGKRWRARLSADHQ